jgi:hypothetical protein
VIAFPGPLSPGNYPDEQPTSSAKLSIGLEPAPAPTIGEAMRDLATAMLTALSGRSAARRKENRWKISQGQPHPPGS